MRVTDKCISDWLIVISSFVLHFVTQGIAGSFGVIYAELLEYFRTGKGETSWIISLCFGLLLSVGPAAGYLTEKWGCWIVSILGSVMAAVGMVTSMFVQDLHSLYITIGIVTGIGFGFAFMVSNISITLQFNDHQWQSFAIAVATSGANIGTMAIPLLLRVFLTEYGWRGTFLLLAGITLHGVVCGMFLLRLRNKEKKEVIKMKRRQNNVCKQVKEIFTNKGFVLFMASGTFTSLGYLIPYIMVPDMVSNKGFTSDQGAVIITVSGLAGILGRLMVGFLIDLLHFSRIITHIVALILGAASTVACVHLNHYWILLVYGGILGGFTGIFGFLQPAISNDLLKRNFGLGFGFNILFEGIAATIGPPIAGLIADSQGSYHGAFYFAGAMFSLGAIVAFPLLRKSLLNKNSSSPEGFPGQDLTVDENICKSDTSMD